MTPLNLLRALQSELSQDLANYRLSSEGSENKKIDVYLQLSNEQFNDESRYPLILLSLLRVTDHELDSRRVGMSVAQIEFTVGVYGEEPETYWDLLNILETMRLRLIRRPLIAGKFRLIYPIETEILETMPYPYYFGYMHASFNIGRPF